AGAAPRPGTALLYDAASAAGAAHDDLLSARTYVTLVDCVGVKDGKLQAGQALAEAAEAALARVGAPLDLRPRLSRDESGPAAAAGALVGAFGLAELALMAEARLHGDDSPEAARALSETAGVMERLGAYAGAAAAYGRALPVLERALGASHPAPAAPPAHPAPPPRRAG